MNRRATFKTKNNLVLKPSARELAAQKQMQLLITKALLSGVNPAGLTAFEIKNLLKRVH